MLLLRPSRVTEHTAVLYKTSSRPRSADDRPFIRMCRSTNRFPRVAGHIWKIRRPDRSSIWESRLPACTACLKANEGRKTNHPYSPTPTATATKTHHTAGVPNPMCRHSPHAAEKPIISAEAMRRDSPCTSTRVCCMVLSDRTPYGLAWSSKVTVFVWPKNKPGALFRRPPRIS